MLFCLFLVFLLFVVLALMAVSLASLLGFRFRILVGYVGFLVTGWGELLCLRDLLGGLC